jgi:hypothetical protein
VEGAALQLDVDPGLGPIISVLVRARLQLSLGSFQRSTGRLMAMAGRLNRPQ